uniref:Coatomer subunit gamma n=1 Tax=Rhizophora mucronata TaxID=61149 RepID=A0A2P2MU99_RHIMU
MSMLQLVTAIGCVMATLFKVRTAANLSIGLEELKNSWRTVIAGVNSRLVTPLSSVIALAASKITISALWRRQVSRKS